MGFFTLHSRGRESYSITTLRYIPNPSKLLEVLRGNGNAYLKQAERYEKRLGTNPDINFSKPIYFLCGYNGKKVATHKREFILGEVTKMFADLASQCYEC